MRRPDAKTAEPMCCGTPMVHNSGSGQYECADAYFALMDDGLGDDPHALDPAKLTGEQRRLLAHWRESLRPDEEAPDVA